MNDEHPTCVEREDAAERTADECAENHSEQWFHAKDAAQVEHWIERETREVFDTDGDKVHGCNPVHSGGELVTYSINPEHPTNCSYSLHFTNFLLEGPDFEPVTEDEEAAIIASILGTN